METPLSRLEQVEEDFELLGNWSERCRYLVDLGRQLPPFPGEAKTGENLIPGCVSEIWMTGSLEDGVMHFCGGSPGLIPQGLVALAIHLYQGLSPELIAGFDVDVPTRLDMDKNLTTTRSAAFRNMMARARDLARKALDV